ncbi:MAG: Mut7-C RNAse domain-containing protein [Acidobacteria bacterium]|nr:Mut7-C RNAse domain-containing protein [Acidobacteriota bacterium]
MNPSARDPSNTANAGLSPLPAFAADVMLGRLARWLRAAGLDVYYDNHASDDQLVRVFLDEKRWIVTRDRRLVRRRILRRAISIESEILEAQLAEFFDKTRLILDRGALRPFSRCIDCNALLQPVALELARARVPPYVFQQHRVFKICPACDKLFWAGTHKDRIQAFLKKSCAL